MTEYIYLSEASLIRLLKLDDVDAYQELYNRHVRPLMIYAYRLVTDWREVEITVADAFTKLWHNRQVFEEGLDLAKQLKSIVNPRLLTVVKQRCDKREKYLFELGEYMKACESDIVKWGNHEG